MDRVLIFTCNNNPKMIMRKIDTWKLLRNSGLFFILYQIVMFILVQFQEEFNIEISSFESDLIIFTSIAYKTIFDTLVYYILIRSIKFILRARKLNDDTELSNLKYTSAFIYFNILLQAITQLSLMLEWALNSSVI